MEDAMMTTRIKQFADQIGEDVRLADAFGDEWVHVTCLHCFFERRCFTGEEFVEKLAANAVQDEDDIERIAKMVEAIKSNQPVSEEDEKWWHESCR